MRSSRGPIHCWLLILLASLLAAGARAEVSTGRDADSGRLSWTWAGDGVSIQLVQLLPDQTRAFFIGRGFDRAAADRIGRACVFQTIFRNDGEQAVQYDLSGWTLTPDFALADIDGAVHQLSDYAGKVVIVNFWATWCPPCREEMPSMERAWQRLRDDGVVMLAINVGEDEETIFAFTANYPVAFPLLMDLDGGVTEQWPIRGLPTTFIVDPGGRLAYRAIGGRAWDDAGLLEQIRVLGDPPAEP
jgi:peroxiredoxin